MSVSGKLLRLYWFRRMARLVGEERAAVLLEFALLAPIFMALLVACAVMGITAFAQQCVQTAAETMSRQVLTGQVQMGGMTQAAFKQKTCAALPSFMDCSRVIIDMQRADDFNSVDTSLPVLVYDSNGNIINTWSFTPGTAGDIVILRVLYIWPVSTGPLGFDISNMGPGQRLLMGTMVFKSEPYS